MKRPKFQMRISMRLILIVTAVLLFVSTAASALLLYNSFYTVDQYRENLYSAALDYCESSLTRNLDSLELLMDVTALDSGIRDNIFLEDMSSSRMLMTGNSMRKIIASNTYLLCPNMSIYSYKFFTYLPGDGRNFFPLEGMEKESWYQEFQRQGDSSFQTYSYFLPLIPYQYTLVQNINDFNLTSTEALMGGGAKQRMCYQAITVNVTDLISFKNKSGIPGNVTAHVFFFADGIEEPVYSSEKDLNEKVMECLASYREGSLPERVTGEDLVSYSPGIREVPSASGTILLLFDSVPFSAAIIKSEMWNMIFIGAIFVVLTVLLLMFYLGYRKRLKVLSDKLDYFAESSPREEEPKPGGDEIGEMERHVVMMQNRLRNLIQEKYETKMQLMSAQHEALIACINPHFLYNTLNTISAMASMEGAESAVEMIYALSDMFKYSSAVTRKEVYLEEEMKNIRDYLEIQRYRYGAAFRYHIDMPDEFRHCLVPKLILQPVVENCFKHGFEARGHREKDVQNEIDVCVVRNRTRLIVYVTDNGRGMNESRLQAIRDHLFEDDPGPGTGGNTGSTEIGLRNVHRRLRMVCGPDCGIELSGKEGEYTCVKVVIRYHDPEGEKPGGEEKS